jgi:hypothetical protein
VAKDPWFIWGIIAAVVSSSIGPVFHATGYANSYFVDIGAACVHPSFEIHPVLILWVTCLLSVCMLLCVALRLFVTHSAWLRARSNHLCHMSSCPVSVFLCANMQRCGAQGRQCDAARLQVLEETLIGPEVQFSAQSFHFSNTSEQKLPSFCSLWHGTMYCHHHRGGKINSSCLSLMCVCMANSAASSPSCIKLSQL